MNHQDTKATKDSPRHFFVLITEFPRCEVEKGREIEHELCMRIRKRRKILVFLVPWW